MSCKAIVKSFKIYSRLARGRINDAFKLGDNTLEFAGILPTLASPTEQPVQVWLVVFGVLMGIVVVAGVYLVVSGVKERRKWVDPNIHYRLKVLELLNFSSYLLQFKSNE